MAETTLDVRGLPKSEGYAQISKQLEAILDGIDDPVTRMATISAVVHHGFGHLWTGFYRVVEPGLLRVGPYQGTLGCIDIAFGRGVCGTCAKEQRTVIVPDIEKFPGHIVCDGRARSEIVLPVFDAQKNLIAVFDVDSEHLAAFDEVDASWLERIISHSPSE